MSRDKKRGRVKSPPFVRIDKSLFNSDAYRACSLTERAMLAELICLHKGDNNGDLFLSSRDAAMLVGVTDHHTASRALRGLAEKGLIAIEQEAHFSIKVRHAPCYRLTFETANGKAPTNEWRSYRAPHGSPEAKRLAMMARCKLRGRLSPQVGVTITTEVATPLQQGEPGGVKITTGDIEKPRFSSEPSGVDFTTHIVCHGQGANKAPSSACKTAMGLARRWIEQNGPGAQGRLATLAGITPSKLSRLLNDPSGRRSLTVDQVERLRLASSVRGHLRAVA